MAGHRFAVCDRRGLDGCARFHLVHAVCARCDDTCVLRCAALDSDPCLFDPFRSLSAFCEADLTNEHGFYISQSFEQLSLSCKRLRFIQPAVP